MKLTLLVGQLECTEPLAAITRDLGLPAPVRCPQISEAVDALGRGNVWLVATDAVTASDSRLTAVLCQPGAPALLSVRYARAGRRAPLLPAYTIIPSSKDAGGRGQDRGTDSPDVGGALHDHSWSRPPPGAGPFRGRSPGSLGRTASRPASPRSLTSVMLASMRAKGRPDRFIHFWAPSPRPRIFPVRFASARKSREAFSRNASLRGLATSCYFLWLHKTTPWVCSGFHQSDEPRAQFSKIPPVVSPRCSPSPSKTAY